ncbi:hypothetical protein SOPP22_07620 [Shewanella sp. OPT22]|nr:hypothetical protein SOPP22_07620 [Shewanella sp. OPT22]
MKTGLKLLLVFIFPAFSVFAATPEQKLVDEALSCASYYQISSHALEQMNVPQMKNVAERLKGSEKLAIKIAIKYDKDAETKLQKVMQQQMSVMKNSTGLKDMIAKYRQQCMTLLSDPDKRLDYWEMALM